MTDALRQLALAIESLAQAHPISCLSDFSHELLHLHLAHLTYAVFSNGIFQLLQAKFNVMKIRDNLPNRRLQIRQQRLEITERTARIIGILRCDSLIGIAIADEVHHSPIFLIFNDVGLSCIGFQKVQNPAIDASNALTFILFPNMIRHGFNVVLQHFHISKYGIIDALQDVFRLSCNHNFIGVIDESIAQWQNVFDGFRVNEMARDSVKFVHKDKFFAKIEILNGLLLFLPSNLIFNL